MSQKSPPPGETAKGHASPSGASIEVPPGTLEREVVASLSEPDKITQPMSILDGPDQLIGTRVLDFQLTSVLGTGGMAAVYRGRHTVTGQQVAVKVLPPELAMHKELKLRFIEEAKALARLDHPNIVTLNNFTVDVEGRFCLVMQYVDGVDFEARIKSAGKVEPREAVRICVEVAKALEYAHAHGVIHRDMKPSNVLVRDDGTVKVTDFGIAKIVGNTRMTTTGQTMGTVRYMSPEQVRGIEVDGRTDVYSLGITLYEALAGEPPFGGEHQFEVMKRQVADPPARLRSRGVAVSPDLEDVVMCCLEKDRERRFPTVASLRAALESVAEGARPGTARRPVLPRSYGAERRARGRALALSLVVIAGAASAAGISALRRPASPAAVALGPGGDEIGRPRSGAPSWPGPHPVAIAHATVVDESFPEVALRVMSATPRDPGPLRDAVELARLRFPSYLAERKIVAPPAQLSRRPLNLVVVSQALLNRADLWDVKPGATYPLRYKPVEATLFVADTPGFERHDLWYGLGLHLCAPLSRLSNGQCEDLAEGFEAYLQGGDGGTAAPQK